jgi:anti-sigma factor RsiW
MSKAMKNETEVLSEADEFEALLPWYVSGKISAADKNKVDAYLVKHPEVRAHMALARDEADNVFAANSEIEAPRAALEKLRASVAASPSARLHSVKASLIDKLGLFLSGLAPRQLAYAGLSAALAIAVLGGSLGSLLSGGQGAGYQTAAGPGASALKGTFALVAFQTAAPAGTLSAFLAENKLTIVEGPKAGGVFRVRLSEQVLSKDATDAALAKLKARADLVSFASSAPETP